MALILNHDVLTLFMGLLVLGFSWTFQAESRQGRSRSLAERHEQWMSTHGRVYNDPAEKEKRSKIFSENSDFVEKFNRQGNKTFKLSTNCFADLTNQEFRQARIIGVKMTNFSRSITPTTSSLDDQRLSRTLPASVDWRTKGAVTSVKNQGYKCGN